jgi:FMN reductase [NAD(P)H]
VPTSDAPPSGLRTARRSRGTDNFLSFINAATDTLLYCQTFCNLAEEEGLGTCFLGTTVYMPQMIIDTLQLPQLVFPVATITLGWPDVQPALSDRMPLASIIHEETYVDYTPERIDAFYTDTESLPENQHFVDINHKETLAQVFTDLRYTRKDNEAMSEGMLKALKQQGFL